MDHNATSAQASRGKLIEEAAVSSSGIGSTAIMERAFAFVFRGLVYPQIWEDPICDMEGLAIGKHDQVVTIASGGCNALSYLVANPSRVTAIDLNTAHVALNRLKQTALRELPDYAHFRRFFALADQATNVDAYFRYIAPALDPASRRYWEARDMLGRKRINLFARGFYRHGLLGKFIGLAHFMARIHGENPRAMLAAETLEEQRHLFETRLLPLFDKPLIRWLTNNPASLFGLGIPPAQYDKLANGKRMADVLRERLGKLCCDFPLSENYFAWQALSRGYEPAPGASLPPYLEEQHYETMRARSRKVDVLHANMTTWLASREARSINRFVFLDAQDWMNDTQINALWSQVCRTAAPGARVLFRTADEPSLLPGRVAPDLLGMWEYRAEQSRSLTESDRSAIYGGVHLYCLKD